MTERLSPTDSALTLRGLTCDREATREGSENVKKRPEEKMEGKREIGR